MPMHLIDKNAIFGKTNRPEWDFSGELDETEAEMYDALYDHRMAAALSDLDSALVWNEAAAEIWSESGGRIDPEELRAWWQETSEAVTEELMAMDAEDLRAAYNSEI